MRVLFGLIFCLAFSPAALGEENAPAPKELAAEEAETEPPEAEELESAAEEPAAGLDLKRDVVPWITVGTGAGFTLLGVALAALGAVPGMQYLKLQNELGTYQAGGVADDAAVLAMLQHQTRNRSLAFQAWGAPLAAGGLALAAGGMVMIAGGIVVGLTGRTSLLDLE